MCVCVCVLVCFEMFSLVFVVLGCLGMFGFFRVVQVFFGCCIYFKSGCSVGCVGQFRLCRILWVGLVSKV